MKNKADSNWLSRTINDVSFAFGQMTRRKLTSTVIIATLGICIGANAFVFNIIHEAMIKPLPYPDSERLAMVWGAYDKLGQKRRETTPSIHYERIKESTLEESAGLLSYRYFNISNQYESRIVEGYDATSTYFDTLQLKPHIGRFYTAEENRIGNSAYVVLMYDFWEKNYGKDPSVIGEKLTVNGVPHEILGVMPKEYAKISNYNIPVDGIQIFVPLVIEESRLDQGRHFSEEESITRLKDGVTPEAAMQEFDAIIERNRPRHTQRVQWYEVSTGFRSSVVPVKDDLEAPYRSRLLILQSAVLLLFLIGCLNVSNIQAGFFYQRSKELAVRMAIGGRRRRILRMLVTEGLVIAMIGALIGILIAYVGFNVVDNMRGFEELKTGRLMEFSGFTVLFAIFLTAIAGCLSGGLAYFVLFRIQLKSALNRDDRTGTSGQSMAMIRNGFVITQVALTFAILIGSGLFIKSFVNVINVDTGFDPDNVLTVRFSLPENLYPRWAEEKFATIEHMLRDIGNLPGVKHAGLMGNLPFGGVIARTSIRLPGRENEEGQTYVYRCPSDGNYFKAMGYQVLKGDVFHEGLDYSYEYGPNGERPIRLCVISKIVADRYFPNEDPVGKIIIMSGRESKIVGVVNDIQAQDLTEEVNPGYGYFHFRHADWPWYAFTIKVAGNTESYRQPIKDIVRRIDPNLGTFAYYEMTDVVKRSYAFKSLMLVILSLFSVSSIGLTFLGLYGVISNSTIQRTKEIGIKMALGASRKKIRSEIIVEALKLVAIGMISGLALVYFFSKQLQDHLYSVSLFDYSVYFGVGFLVLVISILSCLAPAVKAMNLLPAKALRSA